MVFVTACHFLRAHRRVDQVSRLTFVLTSWGSDMRVVLLVGTFWTARKGTFGGNGVTIG